MNPTRRTIRLAGIAGFAAIASLAIFASQPESDTAVRTDLADQPDSPEERAPQALRLRPGAYVYRVSNLSGEVTSADGSVIEAAQPGPAAEFRFSFEQNGTWRETGRENGVSIERSFDGESHRTVVDGEEQPSAVERPEAAERARSAGSSLPAGGPRLELNPAGATFLVQRETAENQVAADAGRANAVETSTFRCGPRTCVEYSFSRGVVEPTEGEYYRSLPWEGENVERATIVFEEQTGLVHVYETSFDDVITHRFELLSSP